jgi:hypothetical protein
MTCTKCAAEVPDNKLVCDCFQVEADNEAKRIGVARFMADQGSLFLTSSGDHLLWRSSRKWQPRRCFKARTRKGRNRRKAAWNIGKHKTPARWCIGENFCHSW